MSLSQVGIRLSDQHDIIIWEKRESEEVTTKLAYNGSLEEWEGYGSK